jgi:hypothetical protein
MGDCQGYPLRDVNKGFKKITGCDYAYQLLAFQDRQAADFVLEQHPRSGC